MIAVILLPGPSPAMLGLDREQSIALLPLGDRPILQHIVESLVTQGIRSIELILWHAPEKIEALLGNGDRWGCRFRYHLAAQPERPYRSLKVIEKTKSESWVLIHGDKYPCVAFAANPVPMPTLYTITPHAMQNETSPPKNMEGNAIATWGGTITFPAGGFSEALYNKSFAELQTYLQQSVTNGQSIHRPSPEWIDASTPDGLLDTQAMLLNRKLSSLMINGIEREPGVWVSRNVEIHPTAKLKSPLYIGPNSRINHGVRLGPNVVISGDCIVDSNTIIDQSLAMAGTYIGEGLELSRTIVDHDVLVNARLGTRVGVSENFLLGGVQSKHQQGWLVRGTQRICAAVLILLFAPILLLSILYFAVVRRSSDLSVQMAKVPLESRSLAISTYPLPCLGADAWQVHRPAGWSPFVRQVLPGLFAVLLGRISIVGLPPKSVKEIERLPQEWHALYVKGRSGLITESALAASDEDNETERYLADAYYAARQSWLYDVKLVLQYMLRLVTPIRNRRSPR